MTTNKTKLKTNTCYGSECIRGSRSYLRGGFRYRPKSPTHPMNSCGSCLVAGPAHSASEILEASAAAHLPDRFARLATVCPVSSAKLWTSARRPSSAVVPPMAPPRSPNLRVCFLRSLSRVAWSTFHHLFPAHLRAILPIIPSPLDPLVMPAPIVPTGRSCVGLSAVFV